jgi:hypothetical protein
VSSNWSAVRLMVLMGGAFLDAERIVISGVRTR